MRINTRFVGSVRKLGTLVARVAEDRATNSWHLHANLGGGAEIDKLGGSLGSRPKMLTKRFVDLCVSSYGIRKNKVVLLGWSRITYALHNGLVV